MTDLINALIERLNDDDISMEAKRMITLELERLGVEVVKVIVGKHESFRYSSKVVSGRIYAIMVRSGGFIKLNGVQGWIDYNGDSHLGFDSLLVRA